MVTQEQLIITNIKFKIIQPLKQYEKLRASDDEIHVI